MPTHSPYQPTMQYQDDFTNPDFQIAGNKSNLLQDWWEQLYPKEFLLTFKNYFFYHIKFFEDIFEEKWDNKVKPMPFLFTAIGISVVIGSMSPWGLKFFELPLQPLSWEQITGNMSTEDFEVFNQTFGLNDFDTITDSTAYFEAVDHRLMERLGTDFSPTAIQLQEYFQKEGFILLASRAEYVNLKHKIEHDKIMAEKELSDFEQLILINLFVFYSMFFWLVSHQFFKNANRTSRETVFVYMYGLVF